MFSGIKKQMEKDKITRTDMYNLVDDISDEVYTMIQITLIVGFALGVICMAIVDKIAG